MEILIKTIDDNGNLNSSGENACITLDKLSLSCKASPNLLRKLFEIQSSRQHNSFNKDVSIAPNLLLREKGYRYVTDVYYQNEVYLQLAFSPLIDLIPSNQLKIKISNHVLYQRDWVDHIDFILKSLKLECHSVTELHIALDAPEIANTFLRLYYSPSLQLVRNGLFGKHDKEKKLTVKNGFHFNKRASDLYITFYNKCADYLEKPHIKAFHENNNLRGNIHRIEIRAKRISLLKTKGFTWQDLGNEKILLQMFRSEFQSRIAFNDISQCSYDENRNKKYLRVHPVDFPPTAIQLTNYAKTRPIIENMKSKKNTVKNLYLQAIKNPYDHNILALREMIEQNNLREWFEAKRNSWGVFSPESVEIVVIQMNRLSAKPNLLKSASWAKRILPKMLILKLTDWKMESLASKIEIGEAA